MAKREARERAAPSYQAYRDRRELAREALGRLHRAGFRPGDFDAYTDSPEALRKLAPPRGLKVKPNDDPADLLANVPEAVHDMNKVRADGHAAEHALYELLRPLVDARRELRDFLPELDERDRLAAVELRTQARAILHGEPIPNQAGSWTRHLVPMALLAPLEADPWQATRADRVRSGIASGLGPDGFPPIRIASHPGGLLTLEDGNHRLSEFRKAGFDVLPVEWLDAGGGPPHH